MRQLFAVALIAAVVAIPAAAQHGGGGHGGGGFHGGGGGFHGGGGFAGHGGGGVHVGAAGGFGPRVNWGAGGYGPRLIERGQGFEGRRGWGGGGAAGRPEFYHRDMDRRRGYGVAYGYGVGLGYGDYGWLDANAPGDDSGYDPSYGDGYGAGPAEDGSYEGGPAPDIPYVADGGDQGRGEETWVQRAAPITRPTVDERDPVTLVFKDGRAPEKIRNYALTRTTLYVTDGRRREIPVAALDLTATEKANRTAGVTFELPALP